MVRFWSRVTNRVAAVGGVVLLLYVAFQVGCWNTAATSRSPDQRHTVRIKELPFGPDSTIKVQLASGLLPVEVVMTGDAWLGFVHITWSPDSSKVGVFVTNRLGGPPIKAGFDLRTKTQVPFGAVRDIVAGDIKRYYALSEDELAAFNGDPFEWASEDAAYERSLSARRQAER